MSGGVKRLMCMLLVAMTAFQAIPAFAAKKSKATDSDKYYCAMDYGFSYNDEDITDGIAEELLIKIGEAIAEKVIGSAVDWGLNNFLSGIFKTDDPVEEELRQINSKLTAIQKLLEELYQRLQIVEYGATMRLRDQKYKEFKPEVVLTMNDLMDSGSEAERKQIIKDWEKKKMMSSSSGITATTQWGDLISTPTAGNTFIQCYDGYAQAAFPWERDAYDFREGTRMADLALYMNASILTGLYYNLVIAGEIPGKTAQNQASNIKAFEKQLNDIIDYFSLAQNKVVRDGEKNRCQLVGLQGFEVYYDQRYIAGFWTNEQGHGQPLKDLMGSVFYNTTVSLPMKGERIRRLYEHYPKMTLLSILRDKIGVKGVNIDDFLLVDYEFYSLFGDPSDIRVLSIDVRDRGYDGVDYHNVAKFYGSESPENPVEEVFERWHSTVQNRFIAIRTNDRFDADSIIDDERGSYSGTIENVGVNSVSLEILNGETIPFNTKNAKFEGEPKVGLTATITYHEENGVHAADTVEVDTSVELSETPVTISGAIEKQLKREISILCDDGITRKCIILDDASRMGTIPEGTPVSITGRLGSDGILYVSSLSDVDYEKPVFPFIDVFLEKGKTLKLKGAAAIPGAWSVEDETIAKINKKEQLKALSPGKTYLRFTVGARAENVVFKGETISPGEMLVIPLTVTNKGESIKSLALAPKKPKISVGETVQMNATWKPESAAHTALTWESSDEAIAAVDENGLVTGVAPGKATIIVTAQNGVSKKRTVTVK